MGPAARPRRRYARWRALSLSLVYVVFAAHILHWKLNGKTLAPLELNEVMYTLELGIITAGFLFMCVLVLGSMIFGRFFCSWACHIMVLQDLCAWLLRRLGIGRKPIRSRLLLWVPPLTAFYMFVWPQIVRTWQARALPRFHLRTDEEGWASLATNDFWRNLPSAPIIALTFLVCGFLIVYLLGSRSFCTYVCPYGAIFGWADRFAPGRIRVNDRCQQCGTCTATCTSGVRVHEEVRRHGMIVNSSCLKDLDCVAACPQNALSYGFGKPAMFRSISSGGRFGGKGWDFTRGEELLIAAVFLIVVFSFRGLYSRIPFLLALALGAIIAYLAVLTLRIVLARPAVLGSIRLRSPHSVTIAGYVYCGLAAVLAGFVAHSAFVRYHEYNGLRQSLALCRVVEPRQRDRLAQAAFDHLRAAERWSLLDNERVERGLLDASVQLRRFDDVVTYAQRVLRRRHDEHAIRLCRADALMAGRHVADAEQEYCAILRRTPGDNKTPPLLAAAHRGLAGVRASRGDIEGAVLELRSALRIEPAHAATYAQLGSALAERGSVEEAVASLRMAVQLDPGAGLAHYNLGTVLMREGRHAEAVVCFEQALAALPDDADVHNNLGYSLLRLGALRRAREHLMRALALDPANVNARFNLADTLAALRRSGHEPTDAAQRQ
ncbi:MAG: tetratricopeptide repeat protein [Phycisphaerae bacterium]|nr:tetratricopeptide repeat protein [Phycisphaerae bacterium]